MTTTETYGSMNTHEAIAVAAVRINGAVVGTGSDHGYARDNAGIDDDAFIDALEEGWGEEGFITTAGRYVSRSEALEIAIRAQQVVEGRTWCADALLAEEVQYAEAA